MPRSPAGFDGSPAGFDGGGNYVGGAPRADSSSVVDHRYMFDPAGAPDVRPGGAPLDGPAEGP